MKTKNFKQAMLFFIVFLTLNYFSFSQENSSQIYRVQKTDYVNGSVSKSDYLQTSQNEQSIYVEKLNSIIFQLRSVPTTESYLEKVNFLLEEFLVKDNTFTEAQKQVIKTVNIASFYNNSFGFQNNSSLNW